MSSLSLPRRDFCRRRPPRKTRKWTRQPRRGDRRRPCCRPRRRRNSDVVVAPPRASAADVAESSHSTASPAARREVLLLLLMFTARAMCSLDRCRDGAAPDGRRARHQRRRLRPRGRDILRVVLDAADSLPAADGARRRAPHAAGDAGRVGRRVGGARWCTSSARSRAAPRARRHRVGLLPGLRLLPHAHDAGRQPERGDGCGQRRRRRHRRHARDRQRRDHGRHRRTTRLLRLALALPPRGAPGADPRRRPPAADARRRLSRGSAGVLGARRPVAPPLPLGAALRRAGRPRRHVDVCRAKLHVARC